MKPYKLAEYRYFMSKSGKSRMKVVYKILACCTYEEILYYVKNTPTSLRGVFKYSLQFLKCKTYGHVYKQPVGFLKEPLDYVGLMAYIVPLFRNEINDFIHKRINFVRNYLLGDFDTCSQIIDSINLHDGYSAWAAINIIKIAGLQGGLDKSLDVFNSIYEQGIVPLMDKTCSAAQDTASIETSMDTFLSKKYQEDIEKYSSFEWQKDYITAHYYPFMHVNPGKWMSYDLKSSIIDLYVNFIYNIGPIIEKYHGDELLNKYLQIIANSVNDVFLCKKMSLLGLVEYENPEDRKKLLDSFAADNEIDDNQRIKSYFEEYPYDIDLLYEYVCYLVRNHKNFPVLFSSTSLFSRIGSLLYSYLNAQDKVKSLNKLKMICFSNSTLLCFRQLYTILSNIESGNLSLFPKRYWIYSYGVNYYDAVFFNDMLARKHYLKVQKFLSSENLLSNQLVNTNVIRYVILFGIFQDERIVALFQDKLRDNIPDYLQGAVLSSIFSVLMQLKKYKEAILLYVENKLKNPELNVFINIDDIEKTLTKSLAARLDIPLELSIFYTQINAKHTKRLSNVLRFLGKQGVKKPSEIKIFEEDNKIKYFLENVVDLNILTTIPLIFPEPSQPIEERVRIIDKLKNVYADKDKKYTNERNSLVRKLGIMNMLKSVDASKIDVDENMLKRHELTFAKEFFELYDSIPSNLMVYKDALAYKALFPDETKEDSPKADNEEVKKVSYRYLIFVKFFLYLRDEFLLNDNAGLDYYLSSRVRHGTIANQLRFNFQELKLTTRKGISGNYDMNLYWTDEIFHLEGEERVKCMDTFLLFTQHIDQIIDDLKRNKIQVKTEKHNSELPACFDFSYDLIVNEISKSYIENNGFDYSAVLDGIFKTLWEITETRFPVVVNAVSCAEQKLKKELDNLYERVKDFIPANSDGMKQFEATYNQCLTHLYEDTSLVSQWFKRKQQQEENFQTQQLLYASAEAINKVRSDKLVLELHNLSYSSFKGCFLIVLFDLFHNIFNNVVDYFDKNNQPPTCKVTVKEEGDWLNIQVSNQIFEKDVADAQEKIDKYKKYHDGLDNRSRSRLEGKSGLYKIDTIVYHQLMGKGNMFEPLIKDDQYVVSISINKLNMISNV